MKMNLFNAADWRNIGWHIGKKLRDILYPPPNGSSPTREERQARRIQDALKGFAYFDTFDEVENWTPADIDPLQQSNIPLLYRPQVQVHDQEGPRTKLMLCHDYKGGYHNYEDVRPGLMQEELYSCEHLNYVETFIYFSHKLVCVPPPTWTNTLHRNGVKVLGTFIVEPQTTDLERLLTMHDGKYIFAERLAAMANTFGFDGWLLNIEKEFSYNVTDKMVAFIYSLKQALGDKCQVIWYDALNSSNEVEYQNGLTAKNLAFADAADALFTNYKWNEARLHESANIALINQIDRSRIYFGIDVWAQNTDMPGPPRITYPLDGGGGTNTGLAARVLAEHGFSAAVFGPAWSWEHFSTSIARPGNLSVAKAVDRSLWQGASLPTELGCDCRKGRPHHTLSYRANPIIASVCEYPVGTSSFFDTDFTRAFRWNTDNEGKVKALSALSLQAALPQCVSLPSSDGDDAEDGGSGAVIYAQLENSVEPLGSSSQMSSLVVYGKRLGEEADRDLHPMAQVKTEPSAFNHRLCLYKLAMEHNATYTVAIVFARTRAGRSFKIDFYSAFKAIDEAHLQYQYHCLSSTDQNSRELLFDLGDEQPHSTLVEVGIQCKGVFEATTPQKILQLTRLTIMPKRPLDRVTYDFRVANLKLIDRGKPPDVHRRLVWEWQGDLSTLPSTLPRSRITGPFSHFNISVGNTLLGVSHCLEFPISDKDIEITKQDPEDPPAFTVIGVCFGNLYLHKPATATLRLREQSRTDNMMSEIEVIEDRQPHSIAMSTSFWQIDIVQ